MLLHPTLRLRAAVGFAVALGASVGSFLPPRAQSAPAAPSVPAAGPVARPGGLQTTTSTATWPPATWPANSPVPPVTAPVVNPPPLHLGNADGTIARHDAFAVVQELWAQRERALAEDDVDTIERLETGVAREVDIVAAREDLARRGPSVALGGREFRGVNVTVGTEPGYPATFLAQLSTSGHGDEASTRFIHILVLTREDHASPWRLAFDADYGGGLKFVHEYYEGPGPTWIDPALVHQELAEYWQHWKNAGTAPDESLFGPGPWTTERGELIASVPQDSLRDVCRCRTHFEYSVDVGADGLYRFGLPEGELVCSAVRIHTVDRPRWKLRLLRQDPDRRNWGGLLAPGWYRSIEERNSYQTCILIRPESDPRGRGLEPIGGGHASDTVAVTGVRASGIAPVIATVLRNLPLLLRALGLAVVLSIAIWQRQRRRKLPSSPSSTQV